MTGVSLKWELELLATADRVQARETCSRNKRRAENFNVKADIDDILNQITADLTAVH